MSSVTSVSEMFPKLVKAIEVYLQARTKIPNTAYGKLTEDKKLLNNDCFLLTKKVILLMISV